MAARGRILFVGGACWYLWNFRRNVIRALVADGWEVVAVAPRDEHAARLDTLDGCRWIDWPLSLEGANPVAEARSLARLVGIARAERPAALIAHTIKANVYGGLAARLLGLPYAVNVTGLGHRIEREGTGARALRRLLILAASGAGRVFVQNPDDLAFLHAAGLPRGIAAVRTMGSGVDLAHFRPMEGAAAAGPPMLLFAGRLQASKGLEEFAEAARLLKARGVAARCVVIGSARHSGAGAIPAAQVAAWEAEGLLEALGPQEDVRPFMAEARAVVLPSRGGEGVPKTALEAAAMGRPLIVTDVPGAREAVAPGETGWLVPPRDPAALADAMAAAAGMDAGAAQAMGAAARARAEALFSDAAVTEAVRAWLAEAAGS